MGRVGNTGINGESKLATGSSKHRRELINLEIDHIRSLLPLKERSLQRLSQLEVMSMACIYIRRCHYLGPHAKDSLQKEEILQALPGFFLVCTADGKLVYISNNITDFLGHSPIDITKQGDNIYDIVDPQDHQPLQHQLLASDHEEEFSLVCRISLSRYTRRQSSFFDEKRIQMSGYFVTPAVESSQQRILVALCTPVLSPAIKSNVLSRTTTLLTSVHSLDMTFIEACDVCEYYLDCRSLVGRSWYNFLAPHCLTTASQRHLEIISSGAEGSTTFQGQYINAQGNLLQVVFCLQLVGEKENDSQNIICTAQVLKPNVENLNPSTTINSMPADHATEMSYPHNESTVYVPEYNGAQCNAEYMTHPIIRVPGLSTPDWQGEMAAAPQQYFTHIGEPYGAYSMYGYHISQPEYQITTDSRLENRTPASDCDAQTSPTSNQRSPSSAVSPCPSPHNEMIEYTYLYKPNSDYSRVNPRIPVNTQPLDNGYHSNSPTPTDNFSSLHPPTQSKFHWATAIAF